MHRYPVFLADEDGRGTMLAEETAQLVTTQSTATHVARRLETKVILYWGFEQGKAAVKASKAASVKFN